MPYELEETGEVTRTAHATVPQEDYESRLNAELRELADEVEISGFRKGNVPLSMVKQRYGNRVRPQVIQDLIREQIQEMVEGYEERLLHVGETEVENIPADGGDLEFSVDFELKPELDPVGYLGLEVEKPEPEVSDEEIDQQLEQLREEFATLEPIELRETIREGDVVTFDFSPSDDRDELQEFTGEGIETEVGSGQVLPAIEQGLEGAELASTIQVEIDADDDFPIEELRGEKIALTVDIKSAKQKVLPELDDAFAKDTGEAETLLELRSDLREQLRDQKEHRAEHMAKRNLIDELIEQNDFEVPPNFLAEQVDSEIERRMQMFEQQGLDPDQLGALSEEFREETRREVERNLKEEFLLLAIAEKDGVEVEEEDLDDFFAHQAHHDDRFTAEQLKQFMQQNEEQWQNVQYQTLLEKTKDRLLEEADLVSVPWPDPENPEQEPADEAAEMTGEKDDNDTGQSNDAADSDESSEESDEAEAPNEEAEEDKRASETDDS